jgi:hypothetical protein
VHEPSATDPEAEENNMFSTNISFWPKKKQKKNNHSNSLAFILPNLLNKTFKKPSFSTLCSAMTLVL